MNETQAARHQRLQRRIRLVGVICGGGLLALLALSPAGSAVAGWSRAVTAGLGVLAPAAALALFVALVVFAWELALLPRLLVARTAGRRSRQASMDRESPQAIAVAAIAAWPAAWCVAIAIQIAVRLFGDWWWVAAGGATAGLLLAMLQAGPSLLVRLSGAKPVSRPALVERLGALARRLAVPIASVDQLPAGSGATATALVAGAGESRRVFIASDLVHDWSDDEIAVVVAHEFGHHAHHDLWRTLGLDTIILSAGFWAADRLAAAGPWASRLVLGDLSALPFVALVVGGVWIASTPLRHAVSRHQERRADAFALRMTGGTDAFRAALRRLASKHLVEERPSRLAQLWFHRHPTVRERLEAADHYDSAVSAGPLQQR